MESDIAGFAERLLAVIDEGRRTATYKLAVLLALMDSCAEEVSERGEPPRQLATRAIARRVAALYWPQVRPFPAPGGPVELRQITNKSATVLVALRHAFAALPDAPTWAAAEERLPTGHVAEVLDVVELTVARYPLVRLQTIDGVPHGFLYDIEWGEAVTLRRLHAGGGAMVVLRPGAAEQLIRLAPLLRPLIELHWVRMVARLNQLDLAETALRHHLFGAERTTFSPAVRGELLELQQGRCLYCPFPLEGTTAVDHFIPWSRWPNDAVENLVLAHGSCNTHKSDRTPGRDPLRRWTEHRRAHGPALRDVADRTGLRSDPERTTSLARSLYAYLPDGAPVWNAPHDIEPARRAELLALLAAL